MVIRNTNKEIRNKRWEGMRNKSKEIMNEEQKEGNEK